MAKTKKKVAESVKKPTNPKDAIGIKKVPMSCLSSQVIALVADAYQEENIAPIDIITSPVLTEHFDAAVSHQMCFWEGMGDTWRIPHVARSMAHIMVLRAAEFDNTLDDDREHTLEDKGIYVADLNIAAAKVIEKVPVCVPPFNHLPLESLGFKVKVTIDSGTPFHVLPWNIVMEMALGMMEGGRKYGRHNYRAVGVRASVYYDATMRHLADWFAGKPIDHESGLSHLSKALSSSQVLLDSMVKGNWVDDRPIRI
jgi:hypothetical protein